MKRITKTGHGRPAALALYMLAWLLPLAAMGKSSDRAAQITTSSTSSSADAGPNGKSVLTGNVRIVQGSLIATSDRADVYTGADSQVSRVVLVGARAHVQQVDDQGHLTKGI